MTITTDLITIETLKPAEVFKPGAVAKLIAEVEAKVRAIPASDHTTEKGRNEIKALAYKVTRSKTALDDMGEQKERDERIAEQVKQDAKEQLSAEVRHVENERQAAIARAERAEAAVKAEAARTLAAERQRVEQARIAEETATKKREANLKHVQKINNAALADLKKIVTEKVGKDIIIAIASGKIAHIRIEY